METNITGQSTNGIIGNYASDYISQAFSYPANAIGGVAQTSSHSGIRGLGAGVQVFGNTLGGSMGKEVYNSILKNGLSSNSVGQGISTGFKNAFDFKGGWTSAGAGLGMNAAGAVLSAIGGPKQEYSGEKGSVTKGLDTAYDIAQTAVGFIPGVGTMVSGLMSLNKGITGMLNKWGGGTDAMTDVDAVLGSSWFGPIGSINGFTGKKAHTMDGKDFMTQAKLGNMWAGYSDTYGDYSKALTKEGKKYGGFSSGARKRANKLIDQQNINKEYLLDMNNETELGNIRGNGMAGLNATAYNIALSGGFKPISLGRQGFKINSLKEAINSIDRTPKSSTIIPWQPTEEEIEKFQWGGKPKLNSKETGEDPVGYSENGTPLYRKGDGTIGPSNGEDNLFELIRNSNANFAKRLQDPNRKYITYPDGSWGNFKLAWSEDETGTIVYPEIQEINGELVDLSNDKEAAWKSAIKHGDYVYFPSNEAAEWFTKNYKDYYKGFNKTPQAFKQGGQMNVIPEGSLHARLHHMEDADGLTKKGIPVVDNEGNQQAEIELNEIIFRKEVTDKLEELSKDGSNKAAEEAGRILVEEIFENTDDRTGLIKELTGDTTVLKAEFGAAMPLYVEWMQKVAKDKNKEKANGFSQAILETGQALVDGILNADKAQKELKAQRQETQLNNMAQFQDEEQRRLAIKYTNEQYENYLEAQRRQLYNDNKLMAQEGDKLPELDAKDIISQLLSLPPEKLKELQNILKYLGQ